MSTAAHGESEINDGYKEYIQEKLITEEDAQKLRDAGYRNIQSLSSLPLIRETLCAILSPVFGDFSKKPGLIDSLIVIIKRISDRMRTNAVCMTAAYAGREVSTSVLTSTSTFHPPYSNTNGTARIIERDPSEFTVPSLYFTGSDIQTAQTNISNRQLPATSDIQEDVMRHHMRLRKNKRSCFSIFGIGFTVLHVAPLVLLTVDNLLTPTSLDIKISNSLKVIGYPYSKFLAKKNTSDFMCDNFHLNDVDESQAICSRYVESMSSVIDFNVELITWESKTIQKPEQPKLKLNRSPSAAPKCIVPAWGPKRAICCAYVSVDGNHIDCMHNDNPDYHISTLPVDTHSVSCHNNCETLINIVENEKEIYVSVNGRELIPIISYNGSGDLYSVSPIDDDRFALLIGRQTNQGIEIEAFLCIISHRACESKSKIFDFASDPADIEVAHIPNGNEPILYVAHLTDSKIYFSTFPDSQLEVVFSRFDMAEFGATKTELLLFQSKTYLLFYDSNHRLLGFRKFELEWLDFSAKYLFIPLIIIYSFFVIISCLWLIYLYSHVTEISRQIVHVKTYYLNITLKLNSSSSTIIFYGIGALICVPIYAAYYLYGAGLFVYWRRQLF